MQALTCVIYSFFQGFVTAVSQMREFVPAVYDLTFAFPKSSPSPTMLRLLKGQPSVVSQLNFGALKHYNSIY